MKNVINFQNLGYHVRRQFPQATQAAKNNAAFILNPYIAKGRLISPATAPEVYDRCNAVLSRLLKVIEIDRDPVKLHIVDDIQANGFILRDTGDVCLTTALLKKEKLTEGELAYVLAHELGHYLTHQPKGLPKRFKNPLFREYALGTAAAKRQDEEYQVDELSLVIMDRAGFSVDEAVTMAERMSGAVGETGKILTPHSTHPEGKYRTGALRSIISSPKYVWQSRNEASKRLFEKDPKFRPGAQKTEMQFNIEGITDPFAIETLNEIARNYALDEKTIVWDFYRLTSNDSLPDRSKLRSFILKLKEPGRKKDVVASYYLQALVSCLYIEAVRAGRGEERLQWLKDKCGIGTAEVQTALLALIKSGQNVFVENIHRENKGEYVDYEDMELDVNFKEFIRPFPRSNLRDLLIGETLRTPLLVKGREKYLMDELELHTLPFTVGEIKDDKAVEFLQLLFGTAIIDEETFLTPDFIDKSGDRTVFEITLGYDLAMEVSVICRTGMPYDRGRMESRLSDVLSFYGELEKFDQSHFIDNYVELVEIAKSHKDEFSRKRVEEFGRIILLRFLETVPAENWEERAFSLVEELPASSEKNHLLVLLHKAGRRAIKDEELVFEAIPRPDEAGAGAQSGDLTLLNSFGFIDTFAAEAVYPSGQRIIDRFMAERLPQNGPLDFDRIVELIPRPSPGRDELLDRAARPILDAYWSPAAAYAKAYQIAIGWMNGEKGKERGTFQAICDITEEFPSLRKRMVREWTDRFGIIKDDYEQVLSARSEVDAVDVYKGGIVEFGGKGKYFAKLSVCLASFASALSRGGFSLLSFQQIDTGNYNKKRKHYHPVISDHGITDPGITEAEIKEEEKERQILLRMKIYADYAPFLSENAVRIAGLLEDNIRFQAHSIPFVDDQPVSNPRFGREEMISEGLGEMKKWDGGKIFSNFMQAMGWEEAIVFYENLFFGDEGIMANDRIFGQLEDIFIRGVGLLLQEKKIPLVRVETVREGMRTLLENQSPEIRAKIWARILAGIAQKLSLGEITREAVKPLGSAGGKLMQAIHSLVAGVDPTLEEATRLALDQTASFSLFDGLQFLGFRTEQSVFDSHLRYDLLGQGTVRAAVGGMDGTVPDEAFLLVHALSSDQRVVRGLTGFIDQIEKKGRYFPLTGSQFRGLVGQIEEERASGFKNHIRYGEHFDWQLGEVRIPRVIENNGDWARLELVGGVPYTALVGEEKQQAAGKIVAAAFGQFGRQTAAGNYLINPEFHPGNIMIDPAGNIHLVDCGLIGEATEEDFMSLLSLLAAFKSQGLPGAAIALFMRKNITSLSEIEDNKRKVFLDSLRTLKGQVDAGTPPELLLPALASVAQKAGGPESTPGIEILFRALQHLAPYLREIGPAADLLGQLSSDPDPAQNKFASELSAGLEGSQSRSSRIIPQGIAVGKRLQDGKIATIGILVREIDLDAPSQFPGMIGVVVEGLKQFVRPDDLRIQKGNTWLALSELAFDTGQ